MRPVPWRTPGRLGGSLAATREEIVNGRARRHYTLTPDGAAALRSAAYGPEVIAALGEGLSGPVDEVATGP